VNSAVQVSSVCGSVRDKTTIGVRAVPWPPRAPWPPWRIGSPSPWLFPRNNYMMSAIDGARSPSRASRSARVLPGSRSVSPIRAVRSPMRAS